MSDSEADIMNAEMHYPDMTPHGAGNLRVKSSSEAELLVYLSGDNSPTY